MTDIDRVLGELNRLRSEVRNIKTVTLRADLDLAELAIDDVQAGTGGGIPVGGIILWSGSVGTIPSGWGLCDGTDGTPDLTDRFVVGAGGTYTPGDTGGADTVTLALSEIPAHVHSISNHVHTMAHTHEIDPPNTNTGAGTAHDHNIAGKIGLSSSAHDTQSHVAAAHSAAGTYSSAVPIADESDHTHAVNIAAFTSDASSAANTGDPTTNPDSGSVGGGGAHENRPPYYALAFIMRLV